jgi:hypothetical protein
MKPVCPRLFEAEAWRDGRLSGAEVARFQAHAEACESCKRELESLEALAEALRIPEGRSDELRVRRERTRLLAAFNAELVPNPRSAKPLRWLGATAAVLALVAWVLVLRRPNAEPAPRIASSAAHAPPAVSVRAESGARWSRHAEAHHERIVLESGELSIQVDHATSPRPLLVILPDGELEDIGTTFSVSAHAGRTMRVTVQEGSVVLRLRAQPALTLSAGQSWTPQAATSSEAPVRSVVPTVPPPRGAKPSSSVNVPKASEPDASAEFRGAMAALDRGDNSQAAALFGAFMAAHARDSRAEDAAYLRVLALQRAGNHGAMQQAARDYLGRYPRGFRRAEIEALASTP